VSVAAVTSRVAEIQGILTQLGGPRATGSTGLAGAFRTSLDTALAGAAGTGAVTASGASPAGARVVAEAEKYLGVPYVWGGTDPDSGLDCSGLVQLVYRNLGIDLPRVSRDQAQAGRPVASLAEAQPGDLIAFNSPVSHIAIYAGDGMMIEAPRPGLSVRLTEVDGDITAIRRVLPESSSPTVSGRTVPVSGVPYADLFNRAAATYGVDASLLSAIARQESGYRPGAVSPAGAQGLMQLMPATARGLGVTDSFDPAQAVDGAARLVRDLLDRFGRTDLALAAYNAGPGAVLRYDGIPPYPETQSYVRSVLAMAGGAL